MSLGAAHGSARHSKRPATQLGDHWTWRPEWRVDRPHLMWYLPCGHDSSLHAWLHGAREHLRGEDGVDVVPDEWLHCTLDDVGFVDELPAEQVDDVALAGREALRGWTVPDVALGPAEPMRDALVLRADPVRQLTGLRDTLRAATVSVLGDRALPPLERFEPHVTFAYANRPLDAAPLMARLQGLVRRPVHVSPPTVTLVAVTRRSHHYQWTTRSRVTGGQPAGRR